MSLTLLVAHDGPAAHSGCAVTRRFAVFLTVWRRSQETGGFSPGELDGAIEGHQSKLLYVRRKKLQKMTASGQLMSTFLTELSELDSIRMA